MVVYHDDGPKAFTLHQTHDVCFLDLILATMYSRVYGKADANVIDGYCAVLASSHRMGGILPKTGTDTTTSKQARV